MQENRAEISKKYGKKVLLSFILFFLTFIIVDAIFAYISIKTNPGVAVEQAYEKGLNYNQTLEEAEEQSKLGWNVELQYLAQKSQISLNLTDKNNKPITGAKISFNLSRPLQAGFESSLQANQAGAGLYLAEAKFPMKGNWQVDAIVEVSGKKFYKSEKIIVE